MIKESFDSLESKLGKRKEFLFDNDLDKLQKEFLANKEKCSVKIIKKAPNKKGENSELPIKEMKYSQNMEEMKQLIPVLKDLMISCPSEEVIFNLLETIDQYSFIRNFKIKTKSEMNNNQALNKFKDNF